MAPKSDPPYCPSTPLHTNAYVQHTFQLVFIPHKASFTSTTPNNQGNSMDRYSKTVLTIIAISLVWTALKDMPIIPDAMASSGVVEVRVVDMNWTRYKPLPVRVEGKIKCE